MSERRAHSEAELIELIGAIDVRAPQALHERVQQLVDGAAKDQRAARRLPPWLAPPVRRSVLGSIAALAVLAVVLVVALSGGGSERLTVSDTAALTLRAPTMAAPQESPRARGELTAAVGGLAFPYWEYAFGYHASGARTDHLGGRAVTTVFYVNDRGQRVGYAIAANGPMPSAGGGVVQWREGRAYHVLSEGATQVVTWVRDGHLCVIAARGVPVATLVSLASWEPETA